ncbi:ATP-binding protein [Methylocystis heyeri]|uniref:ATP-binding protein n=1 Tax=Methylocystis heyeri TaxID=391905 RepID=A0A6B8KI03_9HYPH|nr:ATP-binding protein [Methylocystis heyeri]QGM47252.1 ATP-binding protein [Methylocystis heyeri]
MCDSAETILNLDIVVPNQTRYLRLVGAIAEEIARELSGECPDPDALAYHLNLVVTEAVTNAIQYSCVGGSHNTVRILISIENKDLCVRVYDYGKGFDMGAVPSPDANELKERGRGIFFIRTLMDKVEYRKTDCGNVLEMRKRLG